MHTQCRPEQIEFQGLGRRSVRAVFDGGHISSDGGALLLREVDRRFGITSGLVECFTDFRREDFIEHSVLELLRQPIYPLYVTCGDRLLVSRLRTSDRDQSAGTTEILAHLVERIRERWPGNSCRNRT